MKIQQLFDELEKTTKNKEFIFESTGIVNRFNEMQYGFFPLGLGILTENNKNEEAHPDNEIEEGGIMVLGNDFGTVSYVDGYVKNEAKKIGETDSTTIKNLLNKSVHLNLNKTFFTNFYLGIRLVDGDYDGTTMTKRMFKGKEIKLEDVYKKLCFDFFVKQLELLNPKVVICLGHDVKNALIDSIASDDFANWNPKSKSINKLHEEDNHIISNTILGDRTFIIISHPCDLRNFTKEQKGKLNEILDNC